MNKTLLAIMLCLSTGLGSSIEQRLEETGVIQQIASELSCEEAYDYLVDQAVDLTDEEIEQLMPRKCQ